VLSLYKDGHVQNNSGVVYCAAVIVTRRTRLKPTTA